MEKNGKKRKQDTPRNSSRQMSTSSRIGDERIFKIEAYLRSFSGFDPDHPNPEQAGVRDSLMFAQQLRPSSVIVEPSIKDNNDMSKELRATQEAVTDLKDHFENLLGRVMYHTELCKTLSELRQVSEKSPNRNFFRAVVDIHDCTKATVPEEMKEEMVDAISSALNNLSFEITFEELPSLAKGLFNSGLRAWAYPKQNDKAANSKTA